MNPVLRERIAALFSPRADSLGRALHVPGVTRADIRRVAVETAEAIEERIGIQGPLEEFYRRSPPAMAKPEGSSFHKLVQAMKTGEVILINKDVRWPLAIGMMDVGDIARKIQTFVVEHNWAGALGHSNIEGSFILPYSPVCFEFVLNDRRVCALAFDDPEYGITITPFILLTCGWVSDTEIGLCPDGKWEQRIYDKKAKASWPASFDASDPYWFIGDQIKAICVSLEAEVAVSDVIRAPHKLNVARAKRGALPISDYHIVSLSKRSRVKNLPREDGCHVPERKVRLHFRRGHWRHFENGKTWINWMLVGDPDLGFIDKHYRI